MKDCAHVPEIGGSHRPKRLGSLPQIWELREYLNYNEETGELTWKKSPAHRVKVGDVAGTTINAGYRTFRFKGRMHKAHRVAFAILHGRWPSPGCDHINGNTLDNRACNLREATHSQNMHNKRIYRNNTSGIKGVHYHKKSSGWQGVVKLNGKAQTKLFRNREDAAEWVRELRERLHGEFARH